MLPNEPIESPRTGVGQAGEIARPEQWLPGPADGRKPPAATLPRGSAGPPDADSWWNEVNPLPSPISRNL